MKVTPWGREVPPFGSGALDSLMTLRGRRSLARVITIPSQHGAGHATLHQQHETPQVTPSSRPQEIHSAILQRCSSLWRDCWCTSPTSTSTRSSTVTCWS